MKSIARRTYHSPLREARALETRERILEGVSLWMKRGTLEEFTLESVAKAAGVERRTVFRHFATREALLEAFWVWINQRVAPRPLPATLEELIEAPRQAFAAFDQQEGVIRASLHSPAGRSMRLAAVPARREAFRSALGQVTKSASAADRRRLEALAHLLYSASAWETLRDYAGIDGEEAGDAASWALSVLVASVRRGPSPDEAKPGKRTPKKGS